MVSFVILVVRS